MWLEVLAPESSLQTERSRAVLIQANARRIGQPLFRKPRGTGRPPVDRRLVVSASGNAGARACFLDICVGIGGDGSDTRRCGRSGGRRGEFSTTVNFSAGRHPAGSGRYPTGG